MMQVVPSRKATLQELTRQVREHKNNIHIRLKLSAQIVGDNQGEWKEALARNTAITSVDVRVMHLPDGEEEHDNNNGIYQVLQDLGSLPNLRVLKLSGYCDAMPVEVLTHLLQTATKLTILQLTSVKLSGSKSSLEVFSQAVAAHGVLTELRLLDCQFATMNEDTLFLDSILSGVAASCSLESLSLSPTHPNAMGCLSIQSTTALGTVQSLRLGLIGNFFDADPCLNQSPYQALMTLLASKNKSTNGKLQLLQIPFHPSLSNCQAMQIMLTKNATLLALSLKRTYNNSPEDLEDNVKDLGLVAQGLRRNNRLEAFEFTGPLRIRDEAVLQDFAQVLEVNYTLQDLVILDFLVVVANNSSRGMKYHAKLNQHGRKRWLEDIYSTNEPQQVPGNGPPKQQQQVDFLQTLGRDADDMYYYLSRMKPSFLENLTR